MLLLKNGGETGLAVPLTTMAAAEELSDGRWRVTTATGEALTFSRVDWLVATATPKVTWPALPGTYLVSPNDDGDEPPYWRSNVIGWAVCMDGLLRPISVDANALLDPWTVLHPDGRVECSDGDEFEDTAAWLEVRGPRR